MDKYFATEADIIIDIVYDLDKISLEYLHLTRTFTKSCLNVKLLFCMSLSLYFSIIHIKKY